MKENINHELGEILAGYKNKWVALSPDEKHAVGSGDTLKEAIQEAKINSVSSPIVTKVPQNYGTYIL